MHVRRDRNGEPADELLGLQEPGVPRGDPGLGESEDSDRRARRHPPSASDSWRWYQTARPSLSSTACRAPARPPPDRSPAPSSDPATPSDPMAPSSGRQTGSAIRPGGLTLGPGPPRPRRPHPEQGPLEIRRQRTRHRQGERPVVHDHLITDITASRTPMRPINLPAYGKVEACPRSRRTSPSAA